MIAFATTVASPDRFERHALPGLRRAAEHDSPVAEVTDPASLALAYNEALEAFAAYDDLEALVLLDEDTELLDAGFCADVRRHLDEADDIAILGAGEGGVPTGLPLVLSAWAVRNLRLSDEGADDPAACAAELDAQAAAAGRRSLATPFRVTRHANGARAAGARGGEAPADDQYYEWPRPELAALVPATARRVLDVGCGSGTLAASIKERQGAEVYGIEFMADAAARARLRLDDVVQADLDVLDELPWPEGHFDAVIFGDVLEHLRDPHALLRTVRRHLAPDGVVVCSIPNIKHWTVVFPLIFDDRFTYTDAGLLDRTHVHFFTLREIDDMLTECGFAVEHLGANRIPVAPEYAPIADRLVSASTDAAEQRGRLDVYQYLVVAGRAAD